MQRGIGTRGNADASEAKRKLIRLNWSEPEKERESRPTKITFGARSPQASRSKTEFRVCPSPHTSAAANYVCVSHWSCRAHPPRPSLVEYYFVPILSANVSIGHIFCWFSSSLFFLSISILTTLNCTPHPLHYHWQHMWCWPPPKQGLSSTAAVWCPWFIPPPITGKSTHSRWHTEDKVPYLISSSSE